MFWLKDHDLEIWQAIKQEEERQRDTIILIASENYTSPAVREAMGSCLTHKYAEGYPGKRYYGGCKNVDIVEELARQRAIQLYGSEHANVQPHSGTQANMAVYAAVLKPNDTILSMNLSHGGHLSHGSKVNFSGKLYKTVFYGLNRDTKRIDYEEVRKLAIQHKPKLIIAGASTYPRIIDFKKFREIADEVGAIFMVDMAHIAGLIAAGVHPSPVDLADFITSTTHKTLRGPRGGFILTTKKYADILDQHIFPGIQGGPLMHVIAAKAVAFKEALSEDFKEYQKQVVKNSKVMAKELKEAGFDLVADGSDNHMILIDLRNKGITGKEAEEVLDSVGITVNKNTVPFETRPATITSGIRLGTPLVTTRGMLEKDMVKIVEWIVMALEKRNNQTILAQIRKEVKRFASQFPLFVSSPRKLKREEKINVSFNVG